MEKIAINLLPQEFSQKQKEQKRLRKLQAICASIVLLMIFLASLTLGLRTIQLSEFQKVAAAGKEAENGVSTFKDKEASLTVLKNRAILLAQIKSFPSKASYSFEEILKLTPVEVLVTSSSVDRNGTILLSTIAPSSDSLGKMLANFLSDEGSKTFKEVDIESLSGARDGVFRANFKILPK